ncbi:MAG: GNAT family N-acetyltransferase [Clostridia bacterium]|nr:GNAT family N-acetyltransferase [Clostridia bacterium]
MNVNVDISKTILKTDRLILRPWTLNDLDDFYEYAKVDGVGQMAGWLPHTDKEQSLSILKRFIEQKKTFALEFNGKAIGSLGIEAYNEAELPEFQEKKGRELGFVLSKAYWGQGLMPEAVLAVIKYCFDELKLDFLACGHFTDNSQSLRVQEKCGFKHYKLIKYETRYGIVKDCWLSILENN